VGEAARAEFGAGVGGEFEAISAVPLVAFLAGGGAGVATDRLAVEAADPAVVTDVRSAVVATPAFVLADGVAAVGAEEPFPVGEGDIRAGGVVGPQCSGDEEEEIEQPPLFQRPADGDPSLPLAEFLAPDMRVGHVRIGPGGVRFQGDHSIVERDSRSGATVFEADFEWSQINPLQFDRFGPHGDRPVAGILEEFAELPPQGDQIVIDLARRGGWRVCRPGWFELAVEFPDELVMPRDGVVKLPAEAVGRPGPTAACGALEPPAEPFALAPGVMREDDSARFRLGGVDLSFDSERQPEEFCIGVLHGSGLPVKKISTASPPPGRTARGESVVSVNRPFDFGWGDRDAIPLGKRLVGGARLAVDANQVIARLAGANLPLDQLGDGRPLGDIDVIGEPAAVVVDDQNFHSGVPFNR
jgi:hypothetical protein